MTQLGASGISAGERVCMKPKLKAKAARRPTRHVAEGHSHAPHKMGVNETAVEKILGKADRPLSAYDIIPLMAKQMGHPVAPATVYRALQHLAEHGLVTRIESRNAYILCQHPHEAHDCLFFICRQCGTAQEAPDSQISRLVREEAEALGFGVKKQVMEVIGLCKACAAA
jgi:Fur family zinc uptake transcriptional regulator